MGTKWRVERESRSLEAHEVHKQFRQSCLRLMHLRLYAFTRSVATILTTFSTSKAVQSGPSFA